MNRGICWALTKAFSFADLLGSRPFASPVLVLLPREQMVGTHVGISVSTNAPMVLSGQQFQESAREDARSKRIVGSVPAVCLLETISMAQS